MFLPDDFWRQFGVPEPAGPVWLLAPVLLALVVPAVVVLGCVCWEWFRGDR